MVTFDFRIPWSLCTKQKIKVRRLPLAICQRIEDNAFHQALALQRLSLQQVSLPAANLFDLRGQKLILFFEVLASLLPRGLPFFLVAIIEM